MFVSSASWVISLECTQSRGSLLGWESQIQYWQRSNDKSRFTSHNTFFARLLEKFRKGGGEQSRAKKSQDDNNFERGKVFMGHAFIVVKKTDITK